MTAYSTDTRQSMDSCPPLEDIAAFLDGTLSPEERERMTEHLARCESCYEVFSGAVHFQEEVHSSARDTGGGGVIPFPLADTKDRAPRRTPRWLPLAASVVLVAGLGFFTWRLLEPPKITLAGMVEPIEKKAGAPDVLYKEVIYRNANHSVDLDWDRSRFFIGVHLIDLRLSVNAGKVKAAESHLQGLGEAFNNMPGFSDLGKRCTDEVAVLDDAGTLEPFAPKLPSLEKEIEQYLSDDPSFSFGLWTEGGRLASATHTREFFTRRDNRRFLSSLLKNPPGEDNESLEAIPVDLQAIEAIWDRGDFGEEDYKALERHFQNIIKAYERSSSEHDDLLLPDE